MRSYNYYKVGVYRAEFQCHSERSEESINTSRTRGFFVVPPRAGLLRMTGRNRISGWTLAGTVLIVCFLLLGGCFGKGTQKDTRFYLLTPIAMSSGEQAAAEGEGVGLAIGPVRVREYLNRPPIVTRTKENKIIVHDFHSWGEPLDKNLTAVIAENLTNLLATHRIVIFPWRRRPPDLDYQVVVDVIRFDGDLGGEASLLAHYGILDFPESQGGERQIGIWKSSFTRQIQDDSYEALVATMSELVGDLSRDIAEKIKDSSG